MTFDVGALRDAGVRLSPALEARRRAEGMDASDPTALGPLHTGGRPVARPDLDRPQITLPPDPALSGPRTTGGRTPAPALPGIVSTPVPDAEGTGDGVVTMDPSRPGDEEFEHEVADALREAFPEQRVQFGIAFRNPDGTIAGEVDVFVGHVPIEVTRGRGTGKVTQAGTIERLTGEKPVIIAPRMRNGTERNSQTSGVEVTRSIGDMIEAVRRRLGD